MKLLALLTGLCCAFSAVANDSKSILIIAGTPSHGAGEHEFYDAANILAKALDESGLNLKTSIQRDTWPESAALQNIDVLVLHCDGEDKHVAGHVHNVVRLGKVVEETLGVVETHRLAPLVEIVVEKTANASGLLSMREIEVFVAPLLEAGVGT